MKIFNQDIKNKILLITENEYNENETEKLIKIFSEFQCLEINLITQFTDLKQTYHRIVIVRRL